MQHCQITGRLTKEPELKQTKNGKELCAFTIVSNDGYGDYKTTDFIDCVAYAKSATNISNFFHKGDIITVDGGFHNHPFSTYMGKNGKEYDLPNWQFQVEKFFFPLVPKKDTSVELEVESNSQNSDDTSSPKDFTEISDEDIPF